MPMGLFSARALGAVGVLAMLVGAGCSSSGNGTSRGPSATCRPGLSCCQPGYVGFTQCEGGREVCECQPDGLDEAGAGGMPAGDGGACGAFTPAAAPSFDACGGEPFGLWQATDVTLGPSFEPTELGALSYVPIGGGSCPMLPGKVPTPDFLLDLADGGNAAFAFGAWSFDYQWSSRCSDPNVSRCIQPFASGGPVCTCSDNGCGTSDCTVNIPSSFAGTIGGGGSWTRSGSTITITNVIGFDYCVQGETMQITWGGAVFTMKRVQAGGTPMPCASRSAATCALSGNCHPLCAGGTQCSDAPSESQCTNRQGCTWDTNQCAGTAATQCELADYGVTPGCKLLSSSARCVGSATPCAAKTQSACGNTPGCSWAAGCVGGALECADAFDCTGCNAAAGCSCNQDGSCLGSASFDCTMFDHLESCQAWGRDLELCHWAQKTCNGTPTQCSELSLFDCVGTAGCEIQEK